MSTLLSRRRTPALATTLALAGASLALLPATSAQAVTSTQVGGAATWGISSYINSANMGRPNPYPAGYAAPSTFDATSRLSTWGDAIGSLGDDGAGTLTYRGTSVNFAPTSGAWLKLTDLRAVLDASGNGTVSAVVSYGTSPGVYPNIAYDDSTPLRAAQRVDLVTLTGNTADDRAAAGATTTWSGLDGVWDADFAAFLQGETAAASDDWPYYGQVNANPERTPLPFTFTASDSVPAVAASITSADTTGLTVLASGSGFTPVTNPGDNGVYVGIAPAGGLPDVSDMANMDQFAAVDWVRGAQIVDGAFSRSLTAATAKLDPARSYSVYTWQAHTHSNATQDTETPLAIDWNALKPAATAPAAPAKATPAASLDWAKGKPVVGKKGKLEIALTGGSTAPTGQVTVVLRKLGAKKTKSLSATLVGGAVKVRLPKLTKGRWTAVVAYAGDATHTATEASTTFKVKAKKKK